MKEAALMVEKEMAQASADGNVITASANAREANRFQSAASNNASAADWMTNAYEHF